MKQTASLPLPAEHLKPKSAATRIVATRVSIPLAKALDAFADKNAVTASSVISVALREYLQRHEKGSP
jgi:metal-responsive CopG/Arc/MetJ family transcriptional regulator